MVGVVLECGAGAGVGAVGWRLFGAVLVSGNAKIAALFVEKSGVYSDLPNVELWDEQRDARRYAGPFPVVAHPPCSRWCRLAGLVEARWGHKRGEDGGCFDAALKAVRRWGGVLEHPAYSDAWPAFGLPRPLRGGGWQRGFCGGWSCHVEQGRYGHPAKKATWLYAFGAELPRMQWGHIADQDVIAPVSWCGNKTKRWARIGDFPTNGSSTGWAERRRLSSKEASATPLQFRDVLVAMARSAA